MRDHLTLFCQVTDFFSKRGRSTTARKTCQYIFETLATCIKRYFLWNIQQIVGKLLIRGERDGLFQKPNPPQTLSDSILKTRQSEKKLN